MVRPARGHPLGGESPLHRYAPAAVKMVWFEGNVRFTTAVFA